MSSRGDLGDAEEWNEDACDGCWWNLAGNVGSGVGDGGARRGARERETVHEGGCCRRRKVVACAK